MNLLVDLDGVMANFLKQLCLFHDRPYKPEEITQFSIEKIWGISRNKLWKPTKENPLDFWGNMEPYEYTHEFYQQLTKLGEVTICTSPTNGYSIQGKLQWLERELGITNTGSVVFTSKKHLLAAPDTVLIDDRQSTIEKFQARGGYGITFPQPWNNGIGDWKSVVNEIALYKYAAF